MTFSKSHRPTSPGSRSRLRLSRTHQPNFLRPAHRNPLEGLRDFKRNVDAPKLAERRTVNDAVAIYQSTARPWRGSASASAPSLAVWTIDPLLQNG
jgi:hypothetical protein